MTAGSAPASCARPTSRPVAPASGAATDARTSAPSGARSARSSTEASRRASSCPRPASTASRTGSTSTLRCCSSRSRASATACSIRRRSPSAIACWSPGRGPSGCSRRRSRARSAGRCCSSVCRRTSRGWTSAERWGSRRRRRPCTPGSEFDVVVECSGSAGGAAACLEAARRRGRYVQIGVFGKPVTRSLRSGLREGARRHLGLRVDAELLAACARARRVEAPGARAARLRGGSARRLGACLRRPAGGSRSQGRVRPASVRALV